MCAIALTGALGLAIAVPRRSAEARVPVLRSRAEAAPERSAA
jgi:hypothetical protein